MIIALYIFLVVVFLYAWNTNQELKDCQEEVFRLGGENDAIEQRLQAIEEKDALFHASRMVASQSAEKPQGTPG